MMPSFLPVAGLTNAALSQQRVVTGLGSSCSQPLLANRPSKRVGSGRKLISYSPAAGGAGRSCWAQLPASAVFDSRGRALPAITPDRTDSCQNVSNSPDFLVSPNHFRQNARTISRPSVGGTGPPWAPGDGRPGPRRTAETNSRALLPP